MSSPLLTLEHAMKLADITRKEYMGSNKNDEGSSYFPPGTLEGFSACAITAVTLFPLRGAILRFASRQPGGKSFKHFADIVISVTHALAATNAGLFVGSLYGSRAYLETLSNEPPSSDCTVTDRICNSMWSDVVPPNFATKSMGSEALASWDPRIQTMNSLQQAIETCRQRKEYQANIKK